jgi:Nickel/cobalt transporter regulator
MLRMFAIAAALALAVPTLAAAEEHHPGKPPPPGGGHPAAKPMVAPHGPAAGPRGAAAPVGPRGAGPVGGPHGGGPQFSYRGHMVNRVHLAPFVYPGGWGYRRWGIGMALPALFLAPAYYYADWAAMGLAPPEPGFQWVRYGPDLLLVNVSTGQVVDVVYGAFYEG